MYKLNSQQQQAVEHAGSPLLIVAGAGTGKTTVITQKIGWLVEQELAKPDEILALTFTEKAAGEMQERVDLLMPYGYTDMWIMTFHSFCEKVLRRYGLDIGLSTDFKLLNEFGQWALVKKNLDRFDLDYYKPLGNQTKFISALLKHFSRAKDEDISPQGYLAYVDELKENLDSMLSGGSLHKRGNPKSEILNPKQIPNSNFKISNLTDAGGEMTKEIAEQEVVRLNEVANAYHVYQQLLLGNNFLDFSDLINYTLKLFRERPQVVAQFQKQFTYILVDEFQDTNWNQYALVKMLKPDGKNLTVVGDDDQSIYRFRGASMSNVLQFQKDYPDAHSIVLTQNYRSSQNILDMAYDFIQLNNPNRLEVQLRSKQQTANSKQELNKKLITNSQEQGVIEVLQGKDLQDEVQKVIEKIVALKNDDADATWNDFAVLVRANNSAKEFVSALEIAGIPHLFLAARGLYSRPVIMDVIAYLNLLDNYHESTALYRVLNIAVFNFTHEEVIGFLQLARKKAQSLYEVLKYLGSFSKESGEKIKILLRLVEKHTALVREKKASEVVLAFLNDSGYLKYLSAPASAALTSSALRPALPKRQPTSPVSPEARRGGPSLGGRGEQEVKETMRELNAFLKRVKAFESEANEASVKNFLAELHLELESGEEGSLAMDPEAGPEMVKVMTVHGAKGLEFKYVFIVSMVDLRFPTTERKDPIELPDALVKEIVPEGDTHLEEERRLFYVAMTRAKRGLYFSWAADYGGARDKKPSRFLEELSAQGGPALGRIINNDEIKSASVKIHLVNPSPIIITAGRQSIYELPKFYSYTQLQSYDTCPHQYFRDHVLKIPKPGKHFFSFGQSMHLTLQKFFGLMMQRSGAQQMSLLAAPTDTHPPLPGGYGEAGRLDKHIDTDLKTLLQLYEESWVDDWYEDKAQKTKYFTKGKDALKKFHTKHEGNWPKVIGLEQGFKLRIGGHLMYGKIDRVDDAGDNTVQIVDYKTGQSKDEKTLHAGQKYQLLLYQLSATEIIRKKPANLQFYYLENNSEVNFLGTQTDIEKMQAWVIETIQKIEHSITSGKFPHASEPCRYCQKSDEVGGFLSV